jgi:hypothetical protein
MQIPPSQSLDQAYAAAPAGKVPATDGHGFGGLVDGLMAAPDVERLEKLKSFAARFDPRHMSYYQRREMLGEMARANLVSVEATLAATAYFVPYGYERQTNEQVSSYARRLSESLQRHPSFNEAINYQGLLEGMQDRWGSDPITDELVTLCRDLASLRDADPRFAGQHAVGKDVEVDPVLQFGWGDATRLSFYLGKSDEEGNPLDDQKVSKAVLTWVIRAAGAAAADAPQGDETDDKKLKEVEAAKAAADQAAQEQAAVQGEVGDGEADGDADAPSSSPVPAAAAPIPAHTAVAPTSDPVVATSAAAVTEPQYDQVVTFVVVDKKPKDLLAVEMDEVARKLLFHDDDEGKEVRKGQTTFDQVLKDDEKLRTVVDLETARITRAADEAKDIAALRNPSLTVRKKKDLTMEAWMLSRVRGEQDRDNREPARQAELAAEQKRIVVAEMQEQDLGGQRRDQRADDFHRFLRGDQDWL